MIDEEHDFGVGGGELDYRYSLGCDLLKDGGDEARAGELVFDEFHADGAEFLALVLRLFCDVVLSGFEVVFVDDDGDFGAAFVDGDEAVFFAEVLIELE